MPSLLVTGGAGFIGSNFVHYWLDTYPNDRIVVLDALTYAGNRANLEERMEDRRLRFVHGNITDQSLVESTLLDERVDTIVNFAAESHVDRSIAGPEAFVETNIVGTHRMLSAARNIWLSGTSRLARHRFHHVSTDEVYGSIESDAPPASEEAAYRPNSPYAASKAASDHLVRAYHHTYGLQVTISNCTNNYGPFQHPEKLIPLIIVNILRNEPLPIYGTGTNIRDWLYVKDHCRGIELVLRDGLPGETYNIGGGNQHSNLAVVKLICQLIDNKLSDKAEVAARYQRSPAATGKRSETLISFVEDRPGHDFRYALDTSNIAAAFGFRPHESFESGLRKTVDWFLRNENWWQAILSASDREWRQH